jgi:hypothetical protein
MKKTLVALAVLAASGASFAQVTLSGEAAWGYSSTTTGGATTGDASGFGMNTSDLNFAASEDLGGGNSVSATMGLTGAARGATVAGLDFKMAVKSSLGTLTVGSYEVPNGLSGGIAAAGVWLGQDGKVFTALSNKNVISFSAPVGAFTVAANHKENATDIAEGVGSTGSKNQRSNGLGATYAAGALTVGGTYTMYDNRTSGSWDSAETLLTLAGAYDLGMVKLGLGTEISRRSQGNLTDTYLGLSAPLGAVKVGVEWASRKVDLDGGVTTGTEVNGTRSGYGVAAYYSLSKRTGVVGRYRSWESVAGVANRSSNYGLYLDHNF